MLLALSLAAIKCQQYVTSTMPRVQFFLGFAQQLTQTGKKHKHIDTIGLFFRLCPRVGCFWGKVCEGSLFETVTWWSFGCCSFGCCSCGCGYYGCDFGCDSLSCDSLSCGSLSCGSFGCGSLGCSSADVGLGSKTL